MKKLPFDYSQHAAKKTPHLLFQQVQFPSTFWQHQACLQISLSNKCSESTAWSLGLVVPVMHFPVKDSPAVEPRHHSHRSSALEGPRPPHWGGKGLVRHRLYNIVTMHSKKVSTTYSHSSHKRTPSESRKSVRNCTWLVLE